MHGHGVCMDVGAPLTLPSTPFQKEEVVYQDKFVHNETVIEKTVHVPGPVVEIVDYVTSSSVPPSPSTGPCCVIALNFFSIPSYFLSRASQRPTQPWAGEHPLFHPDLARGPNW